MKHTWGGVSYTLFVAHTMGGRDTEFIALSEFAPIIHQGGSCMLPLSFPITLSLRVFSGSLINILG